MFAPSPQGNNALFMIYAISEQSAGHFPASTLISVSSGSTLVLLVGWKILFMPIFPNDE